MNTIERSTALKTRWSRSSAVPSPCSNAQGDISIRSLACKKLTSEKFHYPKSAFCREVKGRCSPPPLRYVSRQHMSEEEKVLTKKRDTPKGYPFSILFVSAWDHMRRHGMPFQAIRCRNQSDGSEADTFPFPEGNDPARYRYQRLATRMRAMARVSASSALCTSVSGFGSARRCSARALACSALSTSMSEASSAASARMVTLLSAI